MQIGSPCTYTARPDQHPMSPDPSAAIITGWDERAQKASLAVFWELSAFVTVLENIPQGVGPGTFQLIAASVKK